MAHKSQSKVKRWYGRENESKGRSGRNLDEHLELMERRKTWKEKTDGQNAECIVEFPWTFIAEDPKVLPAKEGDVLRNLALKVTHKGKYLNWYGAIYYPILLVDRDGYTYRWIATGKPRARVHDVEVGDTLTMKQCSVKEIIPDQGLTCIFYPREWEIIPAGRTIVF